MQANIRSLMILVVFHFIGDARPQDCNSMNGSGKEPPQEKRLDERSFDEIERMIKDLGAKDFRLRDEAAAALPKTRGSLACLRRHSQDIDLERRKRVQLLIDEISRKNFRRAYTMINKLQNEAPLDLLIDMITENGHEMDKDNWRTLLVTVSAISANLRKTSTNKTTAPEFKPDAYVTSFDPVDVTSKKLGLLKGAFVFGHDITLLRTPVTRESAIVATGAVKALQLDGCFAVLGTSAELSRCNQCVILVNGNLTLRDTCDIYRSVIFSNGNITVRDITESVIIATGDAKVRKMTECELIVNAGKSPRVSLFSSRMLGLTLSQQENVLRVTEVKRGSPAATADFRVGDTIEIKTKYAGDMSKFDRDIRKSLAKDSEVIVSVQRKGVRHNLILSLCHY